jgi:hypothetical protein
VGIESFQARLHPEFASDIWSRDKLLLRAGCRIFFRRVNAGIVSSRSSVLTEFPYSGANRGGCTTHVLRFDHHVRDDGRAAWRFVSAT